MPKRPRPSHPARPASISNPKPSPTPHPLTVGELVQTELFNRLERARVISLDDVYTQAASDFIRAQANHPQTIDLTGDDVTTAPLAAPHPIKHGRVYLHFDRFDRRLDRWCPAHAVIRAPPSDVAANDDAPLHKVRKTRAQKRAYDQVNPSLDAVIATENHHHAAVAPTTTHEDHPSVPRNISTVVLGSYSMDAWYASPFPAPSTDADQLYMCGVCLKYTFSEAKYLLHCPRCPYDIPPGAIVYEDPKRRIEVYEVDGFANAVYCQRLCLLGKLFLDHKTLCIDVTPFIFYVVFDQNELAGFFSKQKPMVPSDYNLACILTLPSHQRKGIGRFMIALSYEISKRQRKTGTPERPLSDLGQHSYRAYWNHTIVRWLRAANSPSNIPVKDVVAATAISVNDVIAILKDLNLLHLWKNENYARADQRALEAAEQQVRDPKLPLDPELLLSTSYDVPADAPATPNCAAPSGCKARRSKKKADKQLRTPTAPPIAISTPPCPRPSTPHSSTPVAQPKAIPLDDQGFTSAQVQAMHAFIVHHGPKVVIAPCNSNKGLPGSVYNECSSEIGVRYPRLRRKLRDMAQAMERATNERETLRTAGVRKVSVTTRARSTPNTEITTPRTIPRSQKRNTPDSITLNRNATFPKRNSGISLPRFSSPLHIPRSSPPTTTQVLQTSRQNGSLGESRRLSPEFGELRPPSLNLRNSVPIFRESKASYEQRVSHSSSPLLASQDTPPIASPSLQQSPHASNSPTPPSQQPPPPPPPSHVTHVARRRSPSHDNLSFVERDGIPHAGRTTVGRANDDDMWDPDELDESDDTGDAEGGRGIKVSYHARHPANAHGLGRLPGGPRRLLNGGPRKRTDVSVVQAPPPSPPLSRGMPGSAPVAGAASRSGSVSPTDLHPREENELNGHGHTVSSPLPVRRTESKPFDNPRTRDGSESPDLSVVDVDASPSSLEY